MIHQKIQCILVTYPVTVRGLLHFQIGLVWIQWDRKQKLFTAYIIQNGEKMGSPTVQEHAEKLLQAARFMNEMQELYYQYSDDAYWQREY